MERDVVSLETAKKLKAAGWGHKTVYRWAVHTLGEIALVEALGRHTDDGWLYPWAAPNAQELADQLPVYLRDRRDGKSRYLLIQRSGKRWTARYEANGGGATGDTLAEALAALWLRLQEVG